MQYLRVKNWEEFQQYQDGRPLHWIKFHLSILDDYTIDSLSEIEQFHLFKIWLLAAKLGNKIPNDAVWVGQKIGARSEVNLNQLITLGLLVPYETVRDCTVTAEAPYLELEKSRAREDKEREEQPRKRAPARTRLAETELPEPWREYCRRKRPELDPDTVFENFRDYWTGHGKAMADWLATWQRWVRNENGSKATGKRESAVAARERRNAAAFGS